MNLRWPIRTFTQCILVANIFILQLCISSSSLQFNSIQIHLRLIKHRLHKSHTVENTLKAKCGEKENLKITFLFNRWLNILYILAWDTIGVRIGKIYCYDENHISANHQIFLYDLLPLIRDVVMDSSRVWLDTSAWIWRYDVKFTKVHVRAV